MKTRFCPSPTGYMHLGNARTALFCGLLAKKSKGVLLLRIEDTDVERSDAAFTRQILEDLRWLGIYWQEGPEENGEHGPYWQSQRQAIYNDYYKKLEATDLVYPCFCSAEELAISRKLQQSRGQPPRYPGTCSQLSKEQIKAKLAQGLQPTLRFRITPKQTITFHDLVKGRQRYNTDDIGDFVIRRADGTPPFLFCNAIDDALMGVTHVIRGEDHVANTPRQLLILQALNLPQPEYGHISMIVGPDGSPLSKRHGSRSIKELGEQGYLATAIVNYLARLGHFYSETTFMNYAELAERFNIENLGKAPARFDANQLLHWQKEAIAHLNNEEISQWLEAYIKDFVPEAKKQIFIEAIQPNILFPQDAVHWAKVFFNEQPVLAEEQISLIHKAGKDFFAQAIIACQHHGNDYQKIMSHLQNNLSVKGKNLYMPLRAALTYSSHGPEFSTIFKLLSHDEILKRLNAALHLCSIETI